MKPDLDAIRARCEAAQVIFERSSVVAPCVYDDIPALLAHIDTLEHMLSEERENVDALRARVAELEAEVAILRPWSVMLKRAHGALTDAGCVVPLEFDQSIEHAIKDLARRATRAEQLFVDEYDARKAAEREIAELKARITTLEAMKP